MSYLFSEAKNANTGYSSPTASAGPKDFSLRAGLILLWMLLVELLRKKVDEIRMRGYSGTIQRAGRVVWLGSLVFFNIRSIGRKAVFGVLWILCATKVVQRIAFTEVGKRSYVHGKNARLITSYMAQMLETDQQEIHVGAGAGDVEHAVQGGHELLKRCKYIVMGEEKLVKEATADGYELNEITPNDNIVTVGKVWELAETDQLFTTFDGDQRLRRLCLSFALFKLLRRRFEHLPAMTKEEARDCRDLIFKDLYNNGEGSAEAVFQVMNDEVNFLSEDYHSVVPVVLASPFFLANYFLLPVAVFGLCLMTIILCGNGDLRFAFSSIKTDNYILRSGLTKIIAICLLSRAVHSPSAFFYIVDLSITYLLFIIFFYEEVWEFLVFLLSNWFMVSLLCNYTAKPHWRESPTFSGAFRRILWLRSKMGHPILSFKQFSVLNLRWPLLLGPPAMLSLMVRSVPVPIEVKHSIMKYLVAQGDHGGANATRLTNGKSALERNNLTHQDLLRACGSDSVAEVILTWHIATSLLEVKCPPHPQIKEEATLRRVATSLSKYCAYLVAFHPELLPDNPDKTERVFEAMREELNGRLGCWEYYVSRRRARVDKIMETTGWMEKKVVRNGATLAHSLLREVDSYSGRMWKVLADVWTELIVYVAPSNDEERVKGHENVLVQGGEFVTVLWALTAHTGISRPANRSTLQGVHPET